MISLLRADQDQSQCLLDPHLCLSVGIAHVLSMEQCTFRFINGNHEELRRRQEEVETQYEISSRGTGQDSKGEQATNRWKVRGGRPNGGSDLVCRSFAGLQPFTIGGLLR